MKKKIITGWAPGNIELSRIIDDIKKIIKEHRGLFPLYKDQGEKDDWCASAWPPQKITISVDVK